MRIASLLLISAMLGSCAGKTPLLDGSQPSQEHGTYSQGLSWDNAQPVAAGRRMAAAQPSTASLAFRDTGFQPIGAAPSAPAEPAPPQDLGDIDPAKPGANRKIVYTAHLGLRVPNKRNAAELVRQVVVKRGGFVQNSTLDDITFRVKPDAFDATVAELETLGETITRNVNSNDITEQYTDVELRLETANSSRQRLLALLEKATATKDVIEIERDIRRLTEEIETMKGRLRVLSDQVDLATITVHLEEKFLDQAPAPRRTSTPYAWMSETGIEQTLATVEPEASLRRGSLFCGSKFRLSKTDANALPDGFVMLEADREYFMAGTSEDFRLRARYFEIDRKQKAGMDFWRDALQNELVNNRGYNVTSTSAFTPNDQDLEGFKLESEVSYSGEKWNYHVWVIRDKEEPNEFVTVEYAHLAGKGASADAVEQQVMQIEM
ncbi:DUF4349 domain-containing protein [Candidatus Sumerlaeota bacterium]|nr:DUF4349 domain-containing protein [Candidatus Sumerlaeota bacterium]